tara:strand:+ start:225 stop:515 length:291 start_codon:yes stop_codon:yes gene_type:complete
LNLDLEDYVITVITVILLYYSKDKNMTKKELINKTVRTLSKLSQEQVQEVEDFASFILKRQDENSIRKGIQKLSESSGSFDFLEEEEILYSVDDLI